MSSLIFSHCLRHNGHHSYMHRCFHGTAHWSKIGKLLNYDCHVWYADIETTAQLFEWPLLSPQPRGMDCEVAIFTVVCQSLWPQCSLLWYYGLLHIHIHPLCGPVAQAVRSKWSEMSAFTTCIRGHLRNTYMSGGEAPSGILLGHMQCIEKCRLIVFSC